MPFPSQVIVTLQNEESFSCPPKNLREKMTGEIEDGGVFSRTGTWWKEASVWHDLGLLSDSQSLLCSAVAECLSDSWYLFCCFLPSQMSLKESFHRKLSSYNSCGTNVMATWQGFRVNWIDKDFPLSPHHRSLGPLLQSGEAKEHLQDKLSLDCRTLFACES